MPRNKTENHEKIVSAAFREFMDRGFQDASMRRIAASCGLSASGLYKHFPGKEDMFAALVDPVIEGFMALYRDIQNDYSEELKSEGNGFLESDQDETVRSMTYIYDHFDEFRLLICKSQGTRYESFTHDVAALEEKVTLSYMKELKRKGVKVNNVEKKEFHLLITASIEALFQAVEHDFTRKEAIHYANTLKKFYLPAWKALFGI